jgi:hypothetical protein
MNEIRKLAEEAQNRAWEVIKAAQIREAWGSIGAEINLVGSLKTGLLVSNLDIDFHIYTSPLVLADSFKAVAMIAEDPRILRITFKNLMETEEMCLEWHAWHQDNFGDTWQIDMIHMPYDSPYAGKFERVAERIRAALTPETRETILTIKNTASKADKVKGIEVAMAVLRDGVRTYGDFVAWKERQELPKIIVWEP